MIVVIKHLFIVHTSYIMQIKPLQATIFQLPTMDQNESNALYGRPDSLILIMNFYRQCHVHIMSISFKFQTKKNQRKSFVFVL